MSPLCCLATLPRNDVRGADGGIRTPDRLITNQQLYRLSYASAGAAKFRGRVGTPDGGMVTITRITRRETLNAGAYRRP